MSEPYTAESILDPTGLAAIRRRPALYLGSTGPLGIAHLAFELVAQGVAAHRAGRAHRLDVGTSCGALSVSHDGDGLSAEVLDHGFDAYGGPPHPTRHADRDRVGVTVVAALSSVMVVVSDGERRLQRVFVQGEGVGPTLDLGPAERRGATFHLVPDRVIFGEARLPRGVLEARLQELAVFNPDLAITLDDQPVPSHGGLAGFARHLAGADGAGHVVEVRADARIEVAVAWGTGTATTRAWVNQLSCDGPHREGLEDGLARTPSLHRVALLGVTLAEAHYDGRTRRILTPEHPEALRRWVREATARAVDAAERALPSAAGGPTGKGPLRGSASA